MARTIIQGLQNKVFILSVIFSVPVFLLFIIPAGFIIFIPFLAFRFILVYILVPVFRRDLRKVVTLGGSLFAAEKIYCPGSYSVVCGFLVQGEPSIEKFREEFTEKVFNKKDSKTENLCYPELKQNIAHWFGYPFWKDLKAFNISECIRELPENELDGSNALQNSHTSSWDCNSAEEKMQLLTVKPWTKDKPLWEILFVRNYTNLRQLQVDTDTAPCCNNSPAVQNDDEGNKKFTLILLRVHHALADGISAVMIFTQAMNNSLEQYTDRYKARQPQKPESRLRKLLKLLTLPFVISYDVIYFLKKDDESHKNPFRLNEKDASSSINSNNILHTASSDPLDKAVIKRIANYYKVSFTAVLFHVIASGIRSAMIQKQGNDKKIPEKINVWLPLPVPNHPDKPRNWLSLGLISLPMRNPNSIQRLKSIHRKLERLKNSTTLFSIFYLSKLHGLVPRWIDNELRKITNCTGFISTLPGPSKIMNVGGYPVIKILFTGSPVPGNLGIMAIFGTYYNSGRIYFRGYKSIFPEQENIQSLMKACIDEFYSLSLSSAV